MSRPACERYSLDQPPQSPPPGGDTARQAGQAAEARLRATAHSYTEGTPLELRLLIVEDHFTRGVGWDLFTPTSPACQVSCRTRLTAYYSSPLPLAETIARILDAG
ncbi:hypothetical protein [Streptomyces bicolor]|uniref:hypothetical protein n=1 Tax=Streptomyces bicolor TaxID=66874 RepID=UPI0004E21681|nr:hypothetical protein [Streptomyces bicolor]